MRAGSPAFGVNFSAGGWRREGAAGALLNVSVSVEVSSLPTYSHHGSANDATAVADSETLTEFTMFGMTNDRLRRSLPEEGVDEVVRCSFRIDGEYPAVLDELSGTVDFVFIDDVRTVQFDPVAELSAPENEAALQALRLIRVEATADVTTFSSRHPFETVSAYRLVDSAGRVLSDGIGEGRNKDVYSVRLPGTNPFSDGVRAEFDLPRERQQVSVPFWFEAFPIRLRE